MAVSFSSRQFDKAAALLGPEWGISPEMGGVGGGGGRGTEKAACGSRSETAIEPLSALEVF